MKYCYKYDAFTSSERGNCIYNKIMNKQDKIKKVMQEFKDAT